MIKSSIQESLPLVTLSEQNGNWWGYFINYHWYYRWN